MRLFHRFALVCLLLTSAFAHAQWDVNANLYGQFSGTTNGNGISQSPQNSPGVLVGLRTYQRPWRGYEVTYSYNTANQNYTNTTLSSVAANAHAITADYVVSMHLPVIGVRPFALAGGGAVIFEPQNNSGITSTDTKAAFNYGAGIDVRLVPHLGLRVQYRGLVYRAPDFGNAFLSTNAFMKTAEPMIGLYLQL